MSSIRELNRQLENGILPDFLNYGKRPSNNEIDMNMLKYNAFYRSYEFFEKKWEKGSDSIPGIPELIQSFATAAADTSPLEEIMSRRNNIDGGGEFADISEQHGCNEYIQQ